MVMGPRYIGMTFNRERWKNRIMKASIIYSPSRRSMRILVRLGRAKILWILGTYFHHSPEQNETATISEWQLDDIYISEENEPMVDCSGIGLDSIISSDHIGTPFVVLRNERGTRIPSTLLGICSIKVVNTRTKTASDMEEFTQVTEELLRANRLTLIDDIEVEKSSEEEVLIWLETAIQNIYECLEMSARKLWG
ncbi:hypothetical protein PHMEG_00017712 [Phytophthora megakarya]|uniref:Uncharacterized protein n=1 Tax=Phytophthora megakarya TaxID=4795 RepID=A0A225VWM4_9STRA|nr:hypothetical protein PHMEG_00017712 [Phytophthora megakarya]